MHPVGEEKYMVGYYFLSLFIEKERDNYSSKTQSIRANHLFDNLKQITDNQLRMVEDDFPN